MVEGKKSYVTVQLQNGVTNLKNAKYKDDLLNLVGGPSVSVSWNKIVAL